VWRVLPKRLHLKAYKLSIIKGVEQWIVLSKDGAGDMDVRAIATNGRRVKENGSETVCLYF
jgi:hypothetical protein